MELWNRNQLLKNFFSLGFLQVATIIIQLLLVPFVIKKIGIEHFGVIAVAQAVMYYLATLSDYGFNQSGTKEVSLNRSNNKILSAVLSRVIYTKLFLCIVSLIILLLLSFLFEFIQQHFLLYSLGFVFVIGQAAMPSWFLQGIEKMHWNAFAVFISKLLFAALVLLFIKEPGDDKLYLFFMGAGSILTGITSLFMICRNMNLSFKKISGSDIIMEIKNGWPITATNLAMNVIQYGNLFILRLFSNDLIAGYFGIAERIFLAVKQVLVIFSQAVYPRLCVIAETGKEGLILFFKKVFLPFFYIILTGSFILYFLSPYIIYYFTHEKNQISIFALRMFCILLPVICLNLPGTLLMLALNRKKPYFLIYFSGMIFCIVSNIILVNTFSVNGTIAAMFLTEMLITVAATIVLYNFWKKPGSVPLQK